ncbi:MAG: hypothetical protein MOP49_315 [Nitrososphaera sp.]|jgi:hypothetical protein|nr:hypothetical protein [Nitrososphaera sp.]MCY1156055.1 hypothetical protein [Nitrososphaera sp.]
MTAIFATLGIGVSIAIIAAGGGFESSSPNILDPPTEADIWKVGDHIQDGMTLEYALTSRGELNSLESALVSMNFRQAGENWNVRFTITNGTGQPSIDHTLVMSNELTREGQLDESFRPYFEHIQSSIFAVRDMEYGESPKYLVLGAPWNTIFVGSSSVTARVTNEERVSTPAGVFDSFVLSYKLAEQTSKIWVVRDMPLPVKAEVYDAEDKLLYQYELVNVSGVTSAAIGNSL